MKLYLAFSHLTNLWCRRFSSDHFLSRGSSACGRNFAAVALDDRNRRLSAGRRRRQVGYLDRRSRRLLAALHCRPLLGVPLVDLRQNFVESFDEEGDVLGGHPDGGRGGHVGRLGHGR